MEFYEAGGGATAKLSFRHEKLQNTILAQELGHNFGFKHTDENVNPQTCPSGESVMASPICPTYPTFSTALDRYYWDKAYFPDSISNYQLLSNQDGCLNLSWDPSQVHNEKSFDLWHWQDGVPTFVLSRPQDWNTTTSFCGQMPAQRDYALYPVSEAHTSFFGAPAVMTVNVSGTLPSITSLVPYGSGAVQLSWLNSYPAGAEVHIQRATCFICSYSELGTDTTTPYVDTNGVQGATTYWYRIRSHSHSGGGYSSWIYRSVLTPPSLPASMGGTFNVGGSPNKVSSCFSPVTGATYYRLLYFMAGISYPNFVTVFPNTSCYGSVLSTTTWPAEVYHIAVQACNGSGCSAWRDMSGSYWWWIPCSSSNGCSAGGSPEPGGHAH